MGPRIFKPLQTSKWRLQTRFWQLLLLTQAPPFSGTPVGRCTISSPSETLESPCASSQQEPICHPPSVPILGFVGMPWHTLPPILSGFGVCLSSCWAHSYEGNFGQLETHPILFRIPSDCLIYYLFIYCTFFLFTATPAAYGNSQSQGLNQSRSCSLCHSHGKAGFLNHRLRPGIKLHILMDAMSGS